MKVINKKSKKVKLTINSREYTILTKNNDPWWDEGLCYYKPKGMFKWKKKQLLKWQVRMYRTWKHNRKQKWKI